MSTTSTNTTTTTTKTPLSSLSSGATGTTIQNSQTPTENISPQSVPDHEEEEEEENPLIEFGETLNEFCLKFATLFPRCTSTQVVRLRTAELSKDESRLKNFAVAYKAVITPHLPLLATSPMNFFDYVRTAFDAEQQNVQKLISKSKKVVKNSSKSKKNDSSSSSSSDSSEDSDDRKVAEDYKFKISKVEMNLEVLRMLVELDLSTKWSSPGFTVNHQNVLIDYLNCFGEIAEDVSNYQRSSKILEEIQKASLDFGPMLESGNLDIQALQAAAQRIIESADHEELAQLMEDVPKIMETFKSSLAENKELEETMGEAKGMLDPNSMNLLSAFMGDDDE